MLNTMHNVHQVTVTRNMTHGLPYSHMMLCDGCTAPLGHNSGSLDIGFSSCAAPTSYCNPAILYVSWISDPQVLGLGSAGMVMGCEDASKRLRD